MITTPHSCVWLGSRCEVYLEDSAPLPWRKTLPLLLIMMSLLFSRSLMPDSWWPHGLQHARLPCPSLSPGVSSNSYLLSQWCHPTISSPVVPISFCHQSFPASGSFPKNRLFESGGQSIGVSAPASVLPVNIQGWFPLGLTRLISLLSKGLSRVFSSTTVQKHQFFDTQPSFWLTMNSSHHRLPDIRAGASFLSASWPIIFQQPPSLVPSPCGLKFQQTTLLGIIWSRATAKWRVWFWNESIYPEWICLSRTLVFCHMSLSSPGKLRADMKEVTRGFQKQLCWESSSRDLHEPGAEAVCGSSALAPSPSTLHCVQQACLSPQKPRAFGFTPWEEAHSVMPNPLSTRFSEQ